MCAITAVLTSRLIGQTAEAVAIPAVEDKSVPAVNVCFPVNLVLITVMEAVSIFKLIGQTAASAIITAATDRYVPTDPVS